MQGRGQVCSTRTTSWSYLSFHAFLGQPKGLSIVSEYGNIVIAVITILRNVITLRNVLPCYFVSLSRDRPLVTAMILLLLHVSRLQPQFVQWKSRNVYITQWRMMVYHSVWGVMVHSHSPRAASFSLHWFVKHRYYVMRGQFTNPENRGGGICPPEFEKSWLFAHKI